MPLRARKKSAVVPDSGGRVSDSLGSAGSVGGTVALFIPPMNG